MRSPAKVLLENGHFGMRRLFPRHRNLLLLFLLLILLAIVWIVAQQKFNSIIHFGRTSSLISGNGQNTTTIDGSTSFRESAEMLDCSRVYRGDKKYVKSRTGKNRWALKEEPFWLDMDCGAIKRRNGFVERKPSREEREMPLAFARIVYRDYTLLEMELLVHWVPQNWYCYVLDEKADQRFRVRMHSLASCFRNVVIAPREFDINRTGTNVSNAFVECARELAKPGRKWNYLVTLQNHDIQAKTNAEMARIFRHLGGANDVEIGRLNQFTRFRLDFYREYFNWTFADLRLFKNESRNHQSDVRGHSPELHLAKGYSTASLTRPFIDFILNQLDLTIFLEQLNQGYFGVDEHFWQSLALTDALNAPGRGFPQKCFECKGKCLNTLNGKIKFVTRYALWPGDPIPCRSGRIRHTVCVFGLEDLGHELEKVPHLFINKMMPEFDFGAFVCWNERMWNRTVRGQIGLDEQFYRDWPQTRYQKLRKKFRGREADLLREFDCKTGKLRKEQEENNP